MDDRISYLNSELRRLSQTLAVLVDALERQRSATLALKSERDELAAALAESNRQMASLIEAIRDAKRVQKRRGEVVIVDFQRHKLH